MLNVSNNKISDNIDTKKYNSFSLVKNYRANKIFSRWLVALFLVVVVLLFLPWTQNIRSKGQVTTLKPDQRPQTIHSVIAGRIEKWYVNEGDFVKKGDTILYLSEIKDKYFDPQLLTRTEEQIKAKELSVSSYMNKVKALDKQADALIQTQKTETETSQ